MKSEEKKVPQKPVSPSPHHAWLIERGYVCYDRSQAHKTIFREDWSYYRRFYDDEKDSETCTERCQIGVEFFEAHEFPSHTMPNGYQITTSIKTILGNELWLELKFYTSRDEGLMTDLPQAEEALLSIWRQFAAGAKR